MIIRAVQASQIPWAFRPPNQAPIAGAEEEGIWIKRSEKANPSLLGGVQLAEDSTEAEEVDGEDEIVASSEHDSGSEGDEAEPVAVPTRFTSAFGALAVDEVEDSSGEEGDSSGSSSEVESKEEHT